MKAKIFIGTVLTLIIPVLLASCARDLPELIDDGDGSANALAITDPYLKCVSYSLGPGSFILVTLVTPPVMNTTWTWTASPELRTQPYQNIDGSYDETKIWVSFPKTGDFVVQAVDTTGRYAHVTAFFLVDDTFNVIIETPPSIL